MYRYAHKFTGRVVELEREMPERERASKWVPVSVLPRPAAKAFDPSEHTVAEVEVYLAEVDAEERERVLALERAGKARKSLLGSVSSA